MTTVTISRQMGSEGHQASQLAAGLLGYRLVWRELINIAARRAGAPEMALAALDELGLLNICPDPASCQAYRQALAQVMHEYAAFGNVIIIGRAGQVILKDRPGVVHIRFIAPMAVRQERVARQFNITPECARSRIEASDHSRQRYLKRFYQADWDEPLLYDLTINTARLEPAQSASMIVNLVRRSPLESNLDNAGHREVLAQQLDARA